MGSLKRDRKHFDGAEPVRVSFAPDADAHRMVAGVPQPVRNAGVLVS